MQHRPPPPLPTVGWPGSRQLRHWLTGGLLLALGGGWLHAQNPRTGPDRQTVGVGDTVTFSLSRHVNLDDGDKITWTRNAVGISNGSTGNGSTYSGVATGTLTITNVQLMDAARYGARIVYPDGGNVASHPESGNLTVWSHPPERELTSFTISPARIDLSRPNTSQRVRFISRVSGGAAAEVESVTVNYTEPDGTVRMPKDSMATNGAYDSYTRYFNTKTESNRGIWGVNSVTIAFKDVTLTESRAPAPNMGNDPTITERPYSRPDVIYNRARLVSSGFPTSAFVGDGPVISTQLRDISARAGSWIEIDTRVAATRAKPVTKWELVLGDPENPDPNQRSGRILQEDSKIYTPAEEFVSAKLLFGPIVAGDGGGYRLRLTNSDGATLTDAATLTVTSVSERSRYVGGRTTLSYPVGTWGHFKYQWMKDGFDIPGATDTDYRIDPIRLNDAGLYSVRVIYPLRTSSVVHAYRLTVSPAPVAPAITAQPASTTVVEGSAASFSVTATGDAPLSYQWSKDGAAIAGATGATYEIASVWPNDAGSYAVEVSNAVGSATSSAAVLTVTPAPVAPEITAQPASATVVEGSAVSFSVTATGDAPLSYQWSKDGGAIAGATGATYEIASVWPNDAGSYAVEVTNEAGSATSAAAALTVTPAPVAPEITAQPAAATVVEGEAVSFSVTATGTEPLAYQWSKDGAAIAGATGATYAIASVWPNDAGSYAVEVTNEAGSATSSAAALTVTPAPVAPEITAQPAAMMVVEGSAVSFSVTATGTEPLAYQWSKDGVAIAGATGATYAIASVWPNDAGSYAVEVTNEAGSATSSAAALTVTPAPVAPEITAQPESATVEEGGAVSFSVTATGTEPLAYQWSKDGTAISGATDSTYAIASVWPNDAGSYAVEVTNEAGSATSAAAVLTVTEAPSALSNISVRMTLEPSQVLLVGAVVTGGSRDLLVRAAGPALDGLGLTGLPDPEFTLYDSDGAVIGASDDWDMALADTFASVGAFAFEPGSADSAQILSAAGAFTVHVSGKDGSGSLLVEAYDLTGTPGARLSNVSARNFTGAGDDMFIAGFAIAGARSHRVLIRAVGPALGEGFLVDPAMTIFDRDQTAITQNDDWSSELASTFAAVGAFSLPADSKDAALVADLAPGTYTVQVRSVDGGAGEALIEIYEILE